MLDQELEELLGELVGEWYTPSDGRSSLGSHLLGRVRSDDALVSWGGPPRLELSYLLLKVGLLGGHVTSTVWHD